MEGARKRRKWDVAAPGGLPLTGSRAGIGSGGGSKSGLNGFITAQGYQAAPPVAAVAAAAGPQPSIDLKPGQSIDQATIARAQQGAQAIVERINAELRAKGQLPPSRGQTKFYDDSKDIACEVPINDAPPPIRYNLTKRSVQDDIQRRTNTIVVIKGRYQAPGTPGNDPEGPLRLRVMPGNVGPDDMVKQRAVDAGASEVRRILQGGSTSRTAPSVSNIPPPDRMASFVSTGEHSMLAPVHMQQGMPTQHGQFASQGAAAQQVPEMAQTVPLYVGVDAPPHFNLHQRLRGPGDSYLQHISSTSGASVTMRGRGSGGVYDSPDHLHLFVSATNPKSFDDAKGLCVNLIDTVRAEHAKMFPPRLPQASQLPAQPQPHISVPLNMPHSQGPASYQQASSSYQFPGQPSQSPSYAAHPVQQSSDTPPALHYSQPSQSPHYSQAPQYPSTSTYPTPSSYPPSMLASAPPSSYPPSSGFRAQAGSSPGNVPQGPSASPHGQANPLQGQTGPLQLQTGPYQVQAGPFQGQGGAKGQYEQAHPLQTAQQPPAHGHSLAGQPSLQQSGGAGQHAQYGQQGAYARPQAPSAGPSGQYGGPSYGQQPGMHDQQRPPYVVPAAPAQIRPDYSSQGPSDPGQGRSGQNQNGMPGLYQGMSEREMAQQAERKRRFTEQKKESQWQQGVTQQPSMPAYGPSPSHSGGQMQQGLSPAQPGPLLASESEVPPLPMGPPPPRPPVQFKMGSMGPPPPRTLRTQGAQVQSHPPVQGLVPYGDDD